VARAAARRMAAVRDCRDCRDLSIRVANPAGNTTALGSRCVSACVRERETPGLFSLTERERERLWVSLSRTQTPGMRVSLRERERERERL
jgi:hypothetical protein